MSRAMKDSGIPWIGEIPESWKIVPFKTTYRLAKGLTITKADLIENGVPVISYGQIHSKSNTGTNIIDSLIRYVPESFILDNSNSLVCKGDIIFADTSEDLEGCGNCIYTDREMVLFAGYHTIIAKNTFGLSSKYIAYLFKTDCWRYQLRTSVNGVKLFSISQKILANTSVILPSQIEQQQIADYLDTKCAEVDELIALQEKMIDELKVYKQSVITEAVTKGLNPDAPLKDSGIEWIGQIPMHWKIVPFKTTYRLTKGLTITKADLVENGVPVISYGQIHSKLNTGTNISDSLIRYVPESFITDNSNSLVCKGDIIFADTSEDLEGCGNCVYIDRKMVLFAGYHTIIAKNTFGLSSKYIAYLFKTDCWRYQLRTSVNGVKLFSISQKILANTSVILPSEIEQQQIADYLDTKCAEIDEMTSIKQQKIEQLKEYKKSIIYEYVTGKKQVNIE